MLEQITTPRGPNPFITYKSPRDPVPAKWVIHRSWRKNEKFIYQDFASQPRRAERQVQMDPPRTQRVAAMLDRERAMVPLGLARNLPPSGNYPTVVGIEDGPGPNPWFGPPPDDNVKETIRGRMADLRNLQFTNLDAFDGGKKPFRTQRPLDANGGNFQTGPASVPNIFTAPIPSPVPVQPVTPPSIVDDPMEDVQYNIFQEPEDLERLAKKVNAGQGRRAGAGKGVPTNAHPQGGSGHTSTLNTSAALNPTRTTANKGTNTDRQIAKPRIGGQKVPNIVPVVIPRVPKTVTGSRDPASAPAGRKTKRKRTDDLAAEGHAAQRRRLVAPAA